MKLTHASKLIGKVVRFDDGVQLLLVSGGVGNGTTFVFKRTEIDDPWIQIPPEDALPYVIELTKTLFDAMSDE